MSLALVFPNGALVAVDSRFTYGTNLPTPRVYDDGFKLRRVRDGWIGATGNSGVMMLGLRLVEQSGLDGARAAIDEAYRVSCTMCADPSRMSMSCFLAVTDNRELRTFWTDGANAEGRERGPDERVMPAPNEFSMRITWPPGADQAEGTALYSGQLSQARSVHDVIRATAAAIAWGAEHGRDASGELELGLTLRDQVCWLRRPARWVAGASDADINAALSAPPLLPEFPVLPAEGRLFKLVPQTM